MLRSAFALACALAVATPGSAQDQPDTEAQARALFAEGQTAYAEGRFEDALGSFQRAYEMSGRPELLYNIGLAAANLGRNADALAAFQRYLQERPDAPNRGVVEGRVNGLLRQIAQSEAEQRRLAEAERARADAEERRRREASASGPLGWVLTVGGGVLLAGGVICFVVGQGDVATVEDAEDGTPWVDLDAANDRAPILTGVGIVAGAAGLLGATIGLVLVASSGGGDEPETRVSLLPGGLRLEGTW